MARIEPFSRTLRALEGSGKGPLWALFGLGLVGLAGWLAWMVTAEVPVQIISSEARIEAEAQSFAIQAPSSGRVADFALSLGAPIEAGEVVLRLENDSEANRIAEIEAELAGLDARIAAVEAQIAAEEQTLALAGRVATASAAESASLADSALVVAQQNEYEAARLEAITGDGVVSDIERSRKRSEAASLRAQAKAATEASRRLALQAQKEQSTLAARVAELRRVQAELAAERASKASVLRSARVALERKEVKAPFAGIIGEVAAVRPGQVVREGDRLATLVPRGELRVIARFDPDSVGRLAPGQPAHVRLDAFPWIEYGTVPATVKSVATEPDGGRIRVELALPGRVDLPISHGQTGRVEVEVDRKSPMGLLLRAAGLRLDRQAR